MSRPPRTLLAGLMSLALCAGCGKRGDPLPPLKRTPLPPSALSVAQRGDQVELRYSVPRTYSDGTRLPVLDVELLRADREGDLEAVALKRVRRAAPGEVLVESEPLPPPGTNLRLAVRVGVGRRFSPLAVAPPLLVHAPQPRPLGLRATLLPGLVRLEWTALPARPDGPALAYRVYRRSRSAEYGAPLGAVAAENRLDDPGATPGESYCYVVRSQAASDPPVESAPSDETCLDVTDVTPPAAPQGGAIFVAADGEVELSWSPSSETDLAGYRIYRRGGERLAELPATQTRWRDPRPPGARRVYTITAYDRAGNESEPSAPLGERTQ